MAAGEHDGRVRCPWQKVALVPGSAWNEMGVQGVQDALDDRVVRVMARHVHGQDEDRDHQQLLAVDRLVHDGLRGGMKGRELNSREEHARDGGGKDVIQAWLYSGKVDCIDRA